VKQRFYNSIIAEVWREICWWNGKDTFSTSSRACSRYTFMYHS